MVMHVVDKPIREVYSEQLGNANVPANNGVRIPIAVRRGFTEVLVECAAAARIHLVPAIRKMYFYDTTQTGAARWRDLLGDDHKAIINRHVAGAATVLMTAADFLYVGFARPVKGLYCDLDGSVKNGEAATLTAAYSTTSKAFASTAITDGTTNGGATLTQDGNVTIDTIPADWGVATLKELLGNPPKAPPVSDNLFWLRFAVNAALDAVEFEQVVPLAEVGAGTITTASQSITVKASTEYTVPIRSPDEVGALEFIAQGGAASTANLTWIKK